MRYSRLEQEPESQPDLSRSLEGIRLIIQRITVSRFGDVRSNKRGSRDLELLVTGDITRLEITAGITCRLLRRCCQAIDRVQTLPGIRSAAAISGFLRTDPEDAVMIEGRLPQGADVVQRVPLRIDCKVCCSTGIALYGDYTRELPG